MNKGVFWLKLGRDYLPLLLFYVLIMGILTLLVIFYHYSLAIVVDMVRFTLPFLLVWLFLRGWHFWRIARKVTQYSKISTNDPVQASLVRQLQLMQQLHERERERIIQKQQAQFDHLELYSHEIKNSLMELQAASENDSHVNSAVVQHAVHQANYYLNMLLNDERLSIPSHDYDFEWIPVKHLVEEILQDNSALFITSQLVPKLKGLAGVSVLTDRKWLRFCINQLLTNAIKYTPKGQTIQILWQGTSILIINPGEGISQSDLARVFENGFSGHNGHQTTKSTGMGLYLVKRTADQLNFQVHLNSIPGKLTTTSLLFPSSNIRQN